jgi:phytoene dehydrogenase-like protein
VAAGWKPERPVARILRTGRRATGIELADGRRITATRAVIAGVAPRALPPPDGRHHPRFDRAMQKFRHAPGTMMIHLAMDGLPDWRAGAALQRFAYVHLAPSLDQMARTYATGAGGPSAR